MKGLPHAPSKLRCHGRAHPDALAGAAAQLAERTILDDLEYLIRNSVDPSRADYAVISGVQIHSWGRAYDDEAPNLEYIAPRSAAPPDPLSSHYHHNACCTLKTIDQHCGHQP